MCTYLAVTLVDQLDGVDWTFCEELREQLVCAYPS